MVAKTSIHFDPNWFHTPPVHPDMSEINIDLMLGALPEALKMTMDQLKHLKGDFTPENNLYHSKEELLAGIEKTLENEITPTEGYSPDIYVIDNFPIFGDLTITADDCEFGLGRISLSDTRWGESLTQEVYGSIPKYVIDSLVDEFDIIYSDYGPSKDSPHHLISDYEKGDVRRNRSWYFKDLYKDTELFAHNLVFAYTNAVLKQQHSEQDQSFSRDE
ncbi:MAG: hypothetical protein GQ477_02875 [Nanohaloarchaea archaeon]|nr:hypothetical protein [Candidatus Nanohaloarchaea archaeon]